MVHMSAAPGKEGGRAKGKWEKEDEVKD